MPLLTNKTTQEHNFRTNFDVTHVVLRRMNARTHMTFVFATMFYHCCISCVQMSNKNAKNTYTLPIVSVYEHFLLANKVEKRNKFVTGGI